jgi:succinyl-diaminopimelate desuccinylase
MKAGVTAALTVFLLFAVEPRLRRGKLHLMLVSDEETGGQWGTDWVLENRPEWRGDVCIIGEPSGTEVVRLGEKGQLWLKLSAQGESYHGGLANGGEPTTQVVAAIQLISGLSRREGKTPSDLSTVLENSRAYAWTPQFLDRTWLLDQLSVNVGHILGGIKVNMAPRDCIAELDLRLPFGMQPAALLDEIKEMISRAHLDVMCTSILARPCPATYTALDHPLVRSALDNASRVVGCDVPAVFAPTFTDARFFRIRNIPAIVYGPRPYSMGGLNEYIDNEDLERVIQVHAGIVWDYLVNDDA